MLREQNSVRLQDNKKTEQFHTEMTWTVNY